MIGWKDLGLRKRTVAAAIGLGTLALGSAVGLAATAAWLIARAAELPSPADLAVAAVLVRTLGIGRGVFRYLERLASHDAALRGMTNLRVRTYERVEAGGAARALSLKRGEIVARMGADMDAVGDAVVRAIVPLGVAGLVSALAVGIVSAAHLGAGAALLACLVAAGLLPALLTARAARVAQERGAAADGALASAVLGAIEASAERQVWGGEDEVAAANAEWAAAKRLAARPAALAAGVLSLASGVALVASVWIAVSAAQSGAVTGPLAAVIALTPLAAFEAVGAVGPAVQQLARSRAARHRIDHLVGPEAQPAATPARSGRARTGSTRATAAEALVLSRLSAAWPGARPTRPASATVRAGEALGIVGPSGIGKTTLLLTLAGALPPAAGTVRFDGREVTPADTGVRIAMTAEDAHVFGTTVLENLRVARGDVTESEAVAALESLGLGRWLAAQPDGLATMLGSGGLSVSGGERRRLLLARALLHPAPVQLVDEPGEHLDRDGAQALAEFLAALRAAGRTVVLVTHDRTLLAHVDHVIDLG